MTGWIRNILATERGWVLVVTLLVMPLVLAFWVYNFQHKVLSISAGHVQSALKQAVEAGAGQVTEGSQARGDPRIGTNQAHTAFRAMLAANLKLNPVTLTPEKDSPLASAPSYSFIVYNGDGTLAFTGAQPAYRYDFDGVTLSSYPISGMGFPQTFAISENDIAYGTGGIYQVELDEPGCVALINAGLKGFVRTESPVIVRWASAEVHFTGER
ncbi:MAG: hypothetical protein H0Z39_03555 [Peptococcaceae bacterium]|nr:hypothetical protein [Peptococcaceae bacterium]